MSERDRYGEVTRWVEATGEELPGMARIVASTTARSMAWTAGAYVRSGRLLAQALTDRKAAEELIHEVAEDVSFATRTVSDVARAIAEGVPGVAGAARRRRRAGRGHPRPRRGGAPAARADAARAR